MEKVNDKVKITKRNISKLINLKTDGKMAMADGQACNHLNGKKNMTNCYICGQSGSKLFNKDLKYSIDKSKLQNCTKHYTAC